MQKYLLNPLPIRETDRTQWRLNIPSGYTHYSLESMNGYVFNQIFIEQNDKLRIRLNLYPYLNYENDDDVDDIEFKGFYEILPDVNNYEDDDFVYCNYEQKSEDDDISPDDDIHCGNCFKYTRVSDPNPRWELSQAEDSYFIYSYCGIVDDVQNVSELITPSHGDYIYNTTTETIWLFDEYTGIWEDSENATKIIPLMRLYKTVYEDDGVPLYNEKYPQQPKRFTLKEIQSLPSIELNLYDDFFNEYISEGANDLTIAINSFTYKPDPIAISKSSTDQDFDNPTANDTSRWFFHTETPDGEGAPYCFNSLISTVSRRNRNQLADRVGVQEIRGSSLFDQFIQYINMHLACKLYDYWIRSDNTYDDEDEISNSLYYRMIDILKFASGEGSYQNNYLTTLWFRSYNGGMSQELLTGYDASFSEKNIPANIKDVYYAILAETSSLKLGTSDTRIIYPVTLISSDILTYGIFKMMYDDYDFENGEQILDDITYCTLWQTWTKKNCLFNPDRLAATRGLSFQLYSRNIGIDPTPDTFVQGTSQLEEYIIEGVMNLKPRPLDVPLDRVYDVRKLKLHGNSHGYFNLWSPQLYITSDDNTLMNVVANIDDISTLQMREDGSKLPDTENLSPSTTIINNVAYMFNQSSLGFSWLTNNLPLTKIPVPDNRKITFSLLDFCGRKIPLRDGDSGLHLQVRLEVNLYKEESNEKTN